MVRPLPCREGSPRCEWSATAPTGDPRPHGAAKRRGPWGVTHVVHDAAHPAMDVVVCRQEGTIGSAPPAFQPMGEAQVGRRLHARKLVHEIVHDISLISCCGLLRCGCIFTGGHRLVRLRMVLRKKAGQPFGKRVRPELVGQRQRHGAAQAHKAS